MKKLFSRNILNVTKFAAVSFAMLATLLIACGDDNGSSATDEGAGSSSSVILSEGSAEVEESSSSVALSSSSNLEPVAYFSSSFVQLREDTEDSSRLTIYRFLYPRADMSLDTGYFNGYECSVEMDGKFSCM